MFDPSKGLSPDSLKHLEGVHNDLRAIVSKACLCSSQRTFIVTEGLRTPARQKALLAAGATQTIHSRHITGHAIDVAALVHVENEWDVCWKWPLYQSIALDIMQAADALKLPRPIWGGSWRTFKDGCHFELDRSKYK